LTAGSPRDRCGKVGDTWALRVALGAVFKVGKRGSLAVQW